MQTTYSSGARTTGSADRSSSQEWAEPDVDMKDVTPKSNKKKLLWRCSAGCTVDGEPFTWESTVSNRTSSDRHGCPGCNPERR